MVAASGGYYIACAADKIFANPAASLEVSGSSPNGTAMATC
jgi:ClpP class serine protease